MLIVIETPNGSQFPRAVYAVTDTADYVQRIRDSHPRSDGVMDIETVDDAMQFEDEALAQRTQIIDQAEYESTEGWSSRVRHVAESLGWEVQS